MNYVGFIKYTQIFSHNLKDSDLSFELFMYLNVSFEKEINGKHRVRFEI